MKVLAVFLFFAAAYARISYNGQSVLSCALTQDLAPAFYTTMDNALVDVWGCHSTGFCDIRIRNAVEKEAVTNFFKTSTCKVLIADLEAVIEKSDNLTLSAPNADDWFTAYHNLADTQAWWQALATQYPTLASYMQIPKSNPLLTTNGNTQNGFYIIVKPENPWIYYQCQIHAREWISGATCQYIANQLLTDYTNKVADAVDLLGSYNFAILTVTNPDGYAFTWTNDRLWRKNRRQNGACYGVDLNRNFNQNWGQGGSSNSPCSETYMGPSVASEAEVKNIAQWWKELQSIAAIQGAVDYHSYSQLVLRPWGDTTAPAPDETRLKSMGDDYASAVKNTSGKVYISEPSIDLYITTGTASDWFYGTGSLGQTKFRAAGFTVELRPEEGAADGFILPPEFIIPTGRENYAGLKAWIFNLRQSPITQ